MAKFKFVLAALVSVAAAIAVAAPSARYVWHLPEWLPPPPVPDDNSMSETKVELGRRLFYDARLSADDTVACASCHDQARAFSDGRVVGQGIEGTLGHRNSPSLANVGYLPMLTWANPHMTTLEFQALVPLFGEDPLEMGSQGREQSIFETLAADSYYETAFSAAFPERSGAIDLFTITRAIGAFQRSLISLDSNYDRAKYGDTPEAMSPAALRGEELFFGHRFECYHCHQGIMFTDNYQTSEMPFKETGFHNTGLYNLNGNGAYPAFADGLIEFTGREADTGKFRTPSLRNIALTAPYMHDGSIETLREVILHYAAGGRTITDGSNAGIGALNPFKEPLIVGFTPEKHEIDDLIAFLDSLTDEGFVTNPDYADPWPDGHPARISRAHSPKPSEGIQP